MRRGHFFFLFCIKRGGVNTPAEQTGGGSRHAGAGVLE